MPKVLSKLLVTVSEEKAPTDRPINPDAYISAYEEFIKLCTEGDKFFNYQPQDLDNALKSYLKAIDIFSSLPSMNRLKSIFRRKGVTLVGSLETQIAAVYASAAHCMLGLKQDEHILLAENMLLRSLECAPEYWGAHYVYVQLFLARKDFTKIKEKLQCLLSKNSSPSLKEKAAYELLRMHQQHPSAVTLDINERKQLFEKYDTKDRNMLVEHGKFLYELGNLKKAENCFRNALRHCHGEKDIQSLCNFNIAQILSSNLNPNRDDNAAINYFLEAVALGNAKALFPAASLLDRDDATVEEKQQAIKLYYQAIEKYEDIQAIHNLGYKLFYAEDLEQNTAEAEQLFLQANRVWHRDGKNPLYLETIGKTVCELGNLYFYQGDLEKAEQHYQQAIHNGQQAGHYGLIKIRHQQEKYRDAFMIAKELSDLDPNNKQMHFSTGLYYLYGPKEDRNYTLAKAYLLKAISKGEAQAFSALLDLYTSSSQEVISLKEIKDAAKDSRLNSNRGHLEKTEFLFLKENIEKLEEQKNAYKIVQLLIRTISVDESITATVKIRNLLGLFTSHDFDEINISTWMLMISKLLSDFKYVPDDLRKDVLATFNRAVCEKDSLLHFSIWSISNIWRSLRYLGVSISHSQLGPIVTVLFRQTIRTIGTMTASDSLQIFSSMTKLLPCYADDFLLNYIL